MVKIPKLTKVNMNACGPCLRASSTEAVAPVRAQQMQTEGSEFNVARMAAACAIAAAAATRRRWLGEARGALPRQQQQRGGRAGAAPRAAAAADSTASAPTLRAAAECFQPIPTHTTN